MTVQYFLLLVLCLIVGLGLGIIGYHYVTCIRSFGEFFGNLMIKAFTAR